MTRRCAYFRLIAIGLMFLAGKPAFAQQCGGDFAVFLDGVKQEAIARGVSPRIADEALASVRINQTVLRRDQAQGVFRQTFLEFSKRSVNDYRMTKGKENMTRYADVFQRAEQAYGVPPTVITAFWGLETDYGAVQGDFNTMNALATLAHDCRRPEIFRPHLIAAIEMTAHGDFDPGTTTGAWAGEIGQVQMLPADIIRYGVDGDGDGHVRLKTSAPDAIMTAAHLIRSLGWRPGEPWIQEVVTPEGLAWQRSGLGRQTTVGEWAGLGVTARNGTLPPAALPADLIAPQGHRGPVFLVYPNFNVYLEWNQSFVYTVTAAYFATRLAGAPRYDAGNPEPGLSEGAMRQLQSLLVARGHDVGTVDGILGSRTRIAVQREQERSGFVADGWPTPAFLAALLR